MKRRFVLLLLMLLAAAPAAAQTDEVVRAALYLTGADSPEELDDRLVDELESFRNRPLPLNRASRARLLDSGLLTPYQVAALAEYRSLSGDVLSFAELERVDGFGKEAVAALRPFLSLESARHPGEAVRDTLKFRHSVLVRATLKDLGAKYRLMAGNVEAAGAWKGRDGTFYGLYRLPKGKILVGDYNVRYGQGLAFWSAFQLAGLTTLDAFSKRANGIAPSWSFNGAGTHRGLAWDYTGRHFQWALFGALALLFSAGLETPRLPQSGAEWGMIAALAVVCSCFGFTLQPVAQRYVSAERAGMFCALNPLTAALLGTLFLGERLGLWGLAGAGLILLGITVQNLHLPRRQKALARNG